MKQLSMDELVAELVSRRVENGVSKAQMARIADVSRQAVQKFEERTMDSDKVLLAYMREFVPRKAVKMPKSKDEALWYSLIELLLQ